MLCLILLDSFVDAGLERKGRVTLYEITTYPLSQMYRGGFFVVSTITLYLLEKQSVLNVGRSPMYYRRYRRRSS